MAEYVGTKLIDKFSNVFGTSKPIRFAKTSIL